MRTVVLALGAAVLAATPALAAACNATSPCPASAPCCSEYGFCGKGAYCLGGCQAFFSTTLDSCRPSPICENLSTTFTDLGRVLNNGTKYDGNASQWDWIVDKGSVVADPDGTGARLILTKTNGGTKLSSTRYVHYGQIDFNMKTSKWPGVVSAAITMSDVKDEIDWEWPGKNTTEAQSNYFFLGEANYSATAGATHKLDSDTEQDFHTYSLNWQEEQLEWLVDGKVVRTLQKADTLKDGEYKYPSTPSRVQISIWPAGINTSAPGTVEWAGGMIDWTDADYLAHGYFFNTLRSINITCADAGMHDATVKGYHFTGNDSGVPTVGFTNASTLLSSDAGVLAAPASVVSLAAAAAVLVPMAWAML